MPWKIQLCSLTFWWILNELLQLDNWSEATVVTKLKQWIIRETYMKETLCPYAQKWKPCRTLFNEIWISKEIRKITLCYINFCLQIFHLALQQTDWINNFFYLMSTSEIIINGFLLNIRIKTGGLGEKSLSEQRREPKTHPTLGVKVSVII